MWRCLVLNFSTDDLLLLVPQLSNAGGRLIIASDGIWDALSSDMAAKSCRGVPAELAAKLVVKVIVNWANLTIFSGMNVPLSSLLNVLCFSLPFFNRKL